MKCTYEIFQPAVVRIDPLYPIGRPFFSDHAAVRIHLYEFQPVSPCKVQICTFTICAECSSRCDLLAEYIIYTFCAYLSELSRSATGYAGIIDGTGDTYLLGRKAFCMDVISTLMRSAGH